MLAGPLFVVTVVAQAAVRDGFDLAHHPLSLLSVGEFGWIQITNFVLAGTLSLGFAVGARRALRPGRTRTWVPRLLGCFGLGLVAGGVFVADPALGFPAGTADAVPESFSWHGALHAAAPPLAFLALVAICLVVAQRFAALARPGASAWSVLVALACVVLSAWPGTTGAGARLFVAVTVGFTWLTSFALVLERQVRAGGTERSL